uniref:Uncharacterized protein n=1 Tax=Clytia hemisphaerica TaxID=252671 RepID=A0A7M5TXY2_9CNID
RKMKSNSAPKLGSNSAPKLGSNSGPKLGSNSGPKLGSNRGPIVVANPNTETIGTSGPRLGRNAGAGPGIKGTQKMSTPCNFYKNTGNLEVHQNTENVLNRELILNVEQTITFQSTDDILQMLKTHPDFERIPPDSLQPIIAGLLSGLMAAVGTIVLAISPIGTALVIKILAGAVLSGGVAGAENALKYGIRGTFTWTKWTIDVALSSSTVLIITGLATYSAWKTVTNFFVNTTEISRELLESIIRTAKITSTLIASLTSSSAEALKKVIKDERIDPLMLVLAFMTGGLQGYSIGSTVSEQTIYEQLKRLSETPEKLW